ncbi:MAG: hypothetical protein M1115_01805 [Actinobacteria bacterium]|nr:hypothetical protein [Actinomycetota bacterium]
MAAETVVGGVEELEYLGKLTPCAARQAVYLAYADWEALAAAELVDAGALVVVEDELQLVNPSAIAMNIPDAITALVRLAGSDRCLPGEPVWGKVKFIATPFNGF